MQGESKKFKLQGYETISVFLVSFWACTLQKETKLLKKTYFYIFSLLQIKEI